MLLLLSHVSRVRLCAIPETGAHQAPVFLPGESHGQRGLAGDIQSMGLHRVGHDWSSWARMQVTLSCFQFSINEFRSFLERENVYKRVENGGGENWYSHSYVQSMRNLDLTCLCVPIGKSRWPGRERNMKTSVATHHLKCENSVEKDQKTHVLHHAEWLKAQGKLFYSCKWTQLCVYTDDVLISLYLTVTVYLEHKVLEQVGCEILTLKHLLAVRPGTNYLTSLCLIILIYKTEIILKAISRVIMKFKWGSSYDAFKIVQEPGSPLYIFSFYYYYHALSWAANREIDK